MHLDIEIDEVGLEIPFPARVVGEDCVDFLRYHRDRAGRCFAAEASQFRDEDFVEFLVIVKPAFDEDALKAVKRDDFARADGRATGEDEADEQ